MKKICLFMGLIVIITGCATTENYEKILNSWVGNKADNLVSSWGPPQNSFSLSDGSTVIEYARSGKSQKGGYVRQETYYSGYATPGGPEGSRYGTATYVQEPTQVNNIGLTCKTSFTVNPRGIITKWSRQGNHCAALPPR